MRTFWLGSFIKNEPLVPRGLITCSYTITVISCIKYLYGDCDCEGDWPRYDETDQLLQLQRDNITAIKDGMSRSTSDLPRVPVYLGSQTSIWLRQTSWILRGYWTRSRNKYIDAFIELIYRRLDKVDPHVEYTSVDKLEYLTSALPIHAAQAGGSSQATSQRSATVHRILSLAGGSKWLLRLF